jgi:probable F420-dependent oxidoreductase
MLELARARSAGTHPYLTLPAQTAEARETLGDGVLVAPEQTVVLDTDPVSARKAAREFLTPYLRLSNYSNTMKRGGFSDDDVQGSGSDDLVDRIVIHGDATTLLEGLRAHLDAGADHVCVQAVPSASALEVYRALAPTRRSVTDS